MKVYTLSLLAVLSSANCTPLSTGSYNVTYQGIYQQGVEAFIGIRYAQDTSGTERFKPPKSYMPSSGSLIQATDPGPACPQALGALLLPLYLGNITEISEDCLRLNVVRPNGTLSKSNLPVMVYIHGGSFFQGSKDDPVSDPAGLIAQSIANGHPIMHVAINYRLGVFGFAQSIALEQEGSENAGLKDQRLALEWVHDNIAAFGGDPGRITIHGQSSGGLAVGMQIMAFGGARPAPFQQAICQSTALEPGITGNYTRQAMLDVSQATGCNETIFDSADTVGCLRALSLDELLQASISTHQEDAAHNIGDQWLPVVDGDFLPAAPSELVDTGRFSNVVSMMGWCEDDMTVFFQPSDVSNATGVHKWLQEYLPNLSHDNLDELLDLYPVSDFQDAHSSNGTLEQTASFYRAAQILRDILMVCPALFYGQALAKNSNGIYYYSQNQTILTPILASQGLYDYGSIHTSEMAYMFANIESFETIDAAFNPKPSASDFALELREAGSWSSFAALGYPSVEGKKTLQGWDEADFENENYGVYVIGGPDEGYAGKGGRESTQGAIALENLQQRCGFLASPELIKQQGW